MRFSKLFKLRNDLSALVLHTHFGESIHSQEKSPLKNNKISIIKSPYRDSFINRSISLMEKNKKNSLNKNLTSKINLRNNFNNNNNITNTNRLQNSFSFLSNIKLNSNNLSLSMNTGLGRNKKLNERRTIEEDFNTSNNQITYNTYSNTNVNTQGNLGTSTNLNLHPMVSIDRYNTVKTETMTRYRNEHLKTEDKDEEKLNGNLFGNQSEVESSKNSMEGKIVHENSLIQIHVKNKNYGNPQESKEVISTNKFIFENLNESLIDIQKIFYDKTVRDIEHYNKWKLKMQNIRVSTLVPKTEQKIPKQKENIIISEDANEDPEKEGAEEEKEDEGEGDGDNKEGKEGGEEDDYLEKKKEKEKNKQKKLKLNREKYEAKGKKGFTKNNDYELYAEYKYSNKTFPEGREHFSLRYNLVDVVLFGGLVMNKNNNNVWTFNPCK
jgi:hypothetical protein